MEQHFVKHTQFYSIKQESAEDRFFRCQWVLNIIMDLCVIVKIFLSPQEKSKEKHQGSSVTVQSINQSEALKDTW